MSRMAPRRGVDISRGDPPTSLGNEISYTNCLACAADGPEPSGKSSGVYAKVFPSHWQNHGCKDVSDASREVGL